MSAPWTFEMVVPDRPIPWERTNAVSGVTKAGKPYTRQVTSARVRSAKQVVSAIAAGARRGRPLLDGPVAVQIVCQYRLGDGRIAPQGATAPVGPPDVDNLSKLILDALNGVWWHDDAQVIDLHVRKHLGPRTGTSVRARDLTDNPEGPPRV